MATSRVNGVSTIYDAAKIICRMVGKYGTAYIPSRTSPEFETAVIALVAACHALEVIDDYVMQIDRTGGTGPEDPPPA